MPYKERTPDLIRSLDPEKTYTFAEWSMYCDIVTWSIMGVPNLPWASANVSEA